MEYAWYEKYGFEDAPAFSTYMSKYYLWSSNPDYIKGLSRSKKKTRAKYLAKLQEQTANACASLGIVAITVN